jgi:NitT/TauT family transport system substrate-binding protein
VQLGHPDAAVALLSGRSEVNSHFSLPPFLQLELADPNVHVVLNSSDVVGGPVSNGVVFGTRKFYEANPKLMAAFVQALEDAMALIKRDPRQAAELYLAATKEKMSAEDLAKIISAPDLVYSTTPQNTMKIAEHFFKSGLIKQSAQSWKDFFFADVHRLPGT